MCSPTETRKCGNCECIATWGHPTPRQSLSALITMPMTGLKSLNLSVAVLQRFHCWYVTLCCDLDLWPWAFVVYRLWRYDTLYQIWAKSNIQRWSYCDLNIWSIMTLNNEHVSRVPLCCVKICTKFKVSQPVRSWNVTIFDADTVYNAVTLPL